MTKSATRLLLCIAHLLLIPSWFLTAAEVTAEFNSPDTIPVTAAGYTATGNTVNISLGFAPSVGTDLTLVQNTSTSFIQGTFDNLQQGEIVHLTHEGVIYRFAANYYGGSGNDLVLQWATHRLAAWGRNAEWLLGDGGDTTAFAPVPVDATGFLAGKSFLAGSIGRLRNLVLCSDGTLAAWGTGRIGSAGFTSSNVPVAVDQSGVLAGKTVIAVAAGRNHSLALCSDGTLASWGFNDSGQLGIGNSNANIGTVPVLVDQSGVLAGKTIVAIGAGINFSLVLCSDGTLASWGANSSGQLGNNNTFQRNQPVLVYTAGVLATRTPVAIAVGGSHALALCSDGSLVAWGSNSNGALGNNSTTNSSVPVLVTTEGTALEGKTIVALTAGGSASSYALASDNTLMAWGANYSGQLGLGDTTARSTAVVVPRTGVTSGKTISSIHTGDVFFRMHFTDGSAATTGDNTDGQLGNNSPSTTSRSSPVLVNTGVLKTGERYAGGYSGPSSRHSVALIASPPAAIGTTDAATAINDSGAALHGRVNPNLTEVTVAFEYGPTPAFGTTVAATPSALSGNMETAVSATIGGLLPGTTYHYRAIATSAGGISYGANQTFTTTISGPPVVFRFDSASTIPLTVDDFEATGLAAEFELNFAPVPGTTLTAVENTGSGPIRGTFANLPQGKIVRLTHAGISYDFAANYFGGSGNDLVLIWAHTRLLGWGINTGQQLGTGLPGATNRLVPTPVDTTGVLAGKTVIAVANAQANSVALCADGTLATWGSVSPVPVLVNSSAVLDGKTPVAVAAGFSHFLVLCSDGTLAAWGSNSLGQLGNGSTTDSLVPVAVDQTGVLANRTPVAITAGKWRNFVLCSDGSLVAWGNNNFGSLGDGTNTPRPTPVLLNDSGALAGRKVSAIAAGDLHTLALCDDGALVAWGRNQVGQVGDPAFSEFRDPVLVNKTGALAGKSVVAIDVGQDHNLALCADGTLAAWGDNSGGQLGNNSTTNSSVPVSVVQSGVLNGKTVAAIVSGLRHNLALCSDGTLASWGSNAFGMIGDNSTSQRNVPVLVNSDMLRTEERFTAAFTESESFHSFAVAASLPPPTATTLAASDIQPESAILNATVNAAGATTSATFEYGLTNAYGSTAPATPRFLTGSATTAVSAAISGLSPGVTYHFRIRANSENGVAFGADMTFTASNPPVFSGYSISTAYEKAATIPVAKLMARASDPDGDAISLTAAGPASANGGVITLAAESITYTPPSGFSGTDTFPVVITDSGGASTTGTVTVNVGPVPTAGGQTSNPPRLSMLPGGGMEIRFQGIPGRSYQIQRSIDLSTWSTIATVTANSTGGMVFIDENPPQPSAYYRLALP